jgi:hypothetical protein
VLASLSLGSVVLQSGLDDVVRANLALPLSLDQQYSLPFMNYWPLGAFSPAVRADQLSYVPYYYVLLEGVFAEP